MLFLRGLCAVALGIAAIAWPGIILGVLVGVFAVFAILDGVFSILIGLQGEPNGTIWWTMVVLGVLAIVAGIAAVAYPGITLAILLWIIAASAIVRGVFEIVAAIRLRKLIDDEWVLGLSGFFSILFGALLLYRPDAGLVALAFLVGAYMLMLGALAIALSLRLRKLQKLHPS
jgi:uncharacterized membrane protein HdeD (DUF308 family)